MTPAARARESRAKRRANLLDQFRNMTPDCAMLDENVDVVEEVVESLPEDNSSPCDTTPDPVRVYNTSSVQTDVIKGMISVDRLRRDDGQISLMTGLETYDKFTYVLQTLGPAAYHLNYRWSQTETLSVDNQFLLTLMKLRRNYSNSELAMFFGVSSKTVSNVFSTWINFMYCQWRELELWPSQDVVAYFTPLDFNKKFPKTRVIIDGTEIPIVKPKDPEAQQKTWSTYKNCNTLKVLVGKFYMAQQLMR